MNDRIVNLLCKRRQDRWQSFVYLSETSGQTELDPDQSEAIASDDSCQISLAETKVGDRIRIVSLNCGSANNRLMGMGLLPGVQLEVVSVTGTGSAIVALNASRLGLEHKIAQQIQVQKADISLKTSVNPSHSRFLAMKQSNEDSGIKLRKASIGSSLKVVSYAPGCPDYKRKLLAMGLTPGTEFVVKRHAPLGDPTEIEVRGFRLSLRKDEADALVVQSV
ncbi:ferrous iron transport protein A [Spirulina subsalsa FACHB-351]|uniref:Ferrous iron transport protein A n=1 Tax=Spirulina subsalsa FACHB-351 TaxID=234711 RepID=A0ABT3L1M1_9CYAN|nr:ferrous iron transport protein A [Spirulina subsalsa]MCW6034930.1 ferrous iron transport protein A [Spirulina subsalsa FACHB-351]